MYYLPSIKTYIGKYNLFTEEEISYADAIQPKYKTFYSTRELIQIFPEAKSQYKKILKEQIEKDKALLYTSLDIERTCANATWKLSDLSKSFWVEACYILLNKPDHATIEKRIKRNAFLLSSFERPKKIEGNITDADILRAKEIPIESLYEGRLSQSGNTLKGICPFHNERTASFYIYTHTNTWYCFGACGLGGSSVDYIMKQRDVRFLEAIKILLKI